MKRKAKSETPKPRNAAAYAMATGRYRNSRHRDRTKYTRKQKHAKSLPE